MIPRALEQIAAQAARHQQKIVLAEGGDARVLAAAERAAAQGLADITVIGNPRAVVETEAETAAETGVETLAESAQPRQPNPANFRWLDPQQNPRAEAHADILVRARKHKALTRAQALEQVRSPLTLAMCMVAGGDADGCVAGAAHTTAEVVRAALQIVGSKSADGAEGGAEDGAEPEPASGLVSSFFLMQHDFPHQALRGPAVFADCAMVIDPDAAQLARIAIDTSDSAVALLKLKPRVALLSFSTAGSAHHPQVAKVREAGAIIAGWRPDLEVMAEVQFDAAVIPEILRRKAPGMTIEAPANIFIFPDLQSANIGYKIAERIGAASAVGPILQGLKRPVNDLSRGCRVEDIVALVAVTAVQAHATR